MPAEIAPVAAFDTTPRLRTTAEAAKAFQALLLRQLFKTMSKTVDRSGLLGDGFESEVYSDMFASAIADVAAGSQFGLDEMIRNAMEPTGDRGAPPISIENLHRGARAYRTALSDAAVPPSNVALARVTASWLGSRSTEQWSPEGTLTTDDLAADIVTSGDGGAAVFNVRDASGYQGHSKCNLFALEMLRRAGYKVPVHARDRGWGYPGADSVTRSAAEGEVSGWARILTSAGLEDLRASAAGGRPLLLTSSAPEGKAGHMAVADEIHAVTRTADGRIASIEYSGWEAGSRGAGYGRRRWHLALVNGPGRGGLDRIEILEPRSAADEEAYHRVGSALPGASVLDVPSIHNVAQGFSQTSDIGNREM